MIFVYSLLLNPISSSAQWNQPWLDWLVPSACGTTLRIRTDPNNSSFNWYRPSRTNAFDWATPNNIPISNPNAGSQLNGYVQSPYTQWPNSITQEVVLEGDYSSLNGWELLMKDFGGVLGNENSPTTVVNFPYIVMYNRFSGKMRTFIAQKNNALQDHLKIQLKLSGPTVPSLLAYGTGIPVAVSNFKKTSITALAPFEGNGGSWTYADFLMAYDPCTCFYGNNYLNFSLTGVSRQTVNLQSQTEGTIVAQGNYNKPGFSFSWDKLGQKYVKSFTSITEFGEETKKYAKLVTGTDTDATKNLIDLMNSSDLLLGGVNVLPNFKLALKLFDIFVASSPSPQSVQLTPMLTKTSGTITGEFTGSNPYGSIAFSIPGSDNANVNDEKYPHYNEALGVVSLLKRPTLFRNVLLEGGPGTGWHSEQISVRDPIQFVINPASGLYLHDALISVVDVSNSTEQFIMAEEDGGSLCANGAFKTFAYDPDDFTQLHPNPYWKLSVTFNLAKHIGGPNVLVHHLYDVDMMSTPGIAQSLIGCNSSFFTNPTTPEIQNFCQNSEYQNGRTLKEPKDDDPTFLLTAKGSKPNLTTFSIKPNPVDEMATVAYNLKQDSKVRVYITDLSGRKVTEVTEHQDFKGEQNIQINTQDLPNGMYMIVFEQDGNQTAKKLVVQH